MTDEFDVCVEGHRFHVSIEGSRYEVAWLDCPDETYPSGYWVVGVGCAASQEPVFDREEIISDIQQWLYDEFSERT